MAPDPYANILVHHGGAFSNDGTLMYDGGEVSVLRNIDTNLMSYNYVIELAKGVGFRDGDTLFYAMPGQSLDSGGIYPLTDYISVFEMMKYSNQTKYLKIYIEHNEQPKITVQMAASPATSSSGSGASPAGSGAASPAASRSSSGAASPAASRSSSGVASPAAANSSSGEAANPVTPSSSGAALMDKSVLEAATSGDAVLVKHLALHDPDLLLGTTPQGTCLHISSMHGHQGFCMVVLELNRSLLSFVNRQGETPLVTAIISGHVTVAESFIVECGRDPKLNEAILKQDYQGYNALHHAIRSGHRNIAMKLIAAEPALSRALNKYHESPMFMAVMRDYEEVFEKLLEIPDSNDEGTCGRNVLHAAVVRGNQAIAKRIMETRPRLARKEDKRGYSPMACSVNWDKIDMIKVLLEHDRSLGYEISMSTGCLLGLVAFWGNVGAAQEILKHCPDAPYRNLLRPDAPYGDMLVNGATCLHQAVWSERESFVEFVLGSPQLREVINMRDSNGITALHLAVHKCNPRMVRALLHHKDIDVTVFDKEGALPASFLDTCNQHAKTINWNEVAMLMSANTITHNNAKEKVISRSRIDIKSLTQTYTSNTSLVAILIATITFAAAFTLPGGYSSDAGNEGLPIMGRKLAFKAFLIADTLAMCSSLSVAFICIISRWEDFEFLLHYRSFTKKLMWFAYMATTTAFATGLCTVLAPRLLWLAISVCILAALLPIFTKLLGEWPILKLRFRLGKTFKSELLDMV